MNVNNIIQIYHKDSGELLKYNNIEFIKNNLYIDNKRVCRNNKYSVEYHCFTCNRRNNVILNTFISKVNRGINRAEGAVRIGTKQLQGGIAQGANTLNTGLMGVEMKTGAMRKGIERVRKDVRTAKAQIGGTRGL